LTEARYFGSSAVDSFSRRNPYVILVFILLFAGLLRVLWIDYSLSTDEIASLNFADLPLSQLWSDWIAVESNPPFYYTVLQIWQFFFGTSDVAARMLSVVAALIGLPVVFLLGRSVAGPGVGLLATAYVAVLPAHLMFSQQVRGYIISFDFACLALLGAIQFSDHYLNKNKRKEGGVGLTIYTFAAIVTVYCHTTMVLLPIITTAFIILLAFTVMPVADRIRFLAQWFAAQAVVLLAWSWWGFITLKQMLNPSDNIQWIPEPTVLDALGMTLRSYAPPGVEFGNPVVATVAFCLFTLPAIVLFVRGGLARRTVAVSLMVFVAIALPACLYVLSQAVPVFLPRTVFWGSGAFAIVVAVGLASIPAASIRHACVATVLLGTLAASLSVSHRFELEPWQQIVTTIQGRDPQATVIAGNRIVAMNLRRYCQPPQCRLDIREIVKTEPWNRDFAGAPEIKPDDIAALLADAGTVVAVSRGRGGAEDHLQPVGREAERLAVKLPPHLRLSVWTSR
jgi:mannosyltransferase